MIVMYLGKADVNTYEKGSSREFLTTNGWGGYGFSTVIGANTRREHGLLVLNKSGKEVYPDVLISKLDETVISRGKKYHLSTNRYTDVVFPDGYRYLQEYHAEPLPGMLFVIHSVFLRKTVFMPRKRLSTIIKYELLSAPEKIELEIRPLAAHRGIDQVCSHKDRDFSSSFSGNCVSIEGSDLQSRFYHFNGEWRPKPLWFENLIYEFDECEKPGTDNLWSPGVLSVDMSEGDTIYIVLSSGVEKYDHGVCSELEDITVRWIASNVSETPLMKKTPMARDLIQSASHCISEIEGGKPVIFTGYPSVREKARETFISIPGLLLSTGKMEFARNLLEVWLDRAAGNGNLMPSGIDPHTGRLTSESADSGLWFFYAFGKYCDRSESTTLAEKRWDDITALALKIIEGIPEIGLSLDKDGLLDLRSKSIGSNWMDGSNNGTAIVERHGKLVEFNALWYNGLRTLEQLAELTGRADQARDFGKMADLCGTSFKKVFWNEKGYLYDWVDGDKKSDSNRCNQILAASLPVSVMDPERSRSIVESCWNDLYTTFGLRTLDPHHDKYKGRCEGRLDQREKARFMGMAWPWMLGQFITAFLRYNPDRKDIAWCFLRPFLSHLRKGCLGGVAEVFDGSMPYRPHGNALYAPSVAELLRVISEDM